FLRRDAGFLGRHLRGERRGLARAAEAASARGRPGKRVPLAIGDRDDRVVERRVDVRDAVEHVLARLLRLLSAVSLLFFSHVSTSLLNLARRSVQLHRLPARTLARARVRAGALATDRQTLAM